MKIANIVPPSLLESVIGVFPQEDYHLILASEVVRNWQYREFYRNRIRAGDHVILDNDAYEQDGVSSQVVDLLEALEELQELPKELVLPDVMFGPNCAEETRCRSTEAAADLLWGPKAAREKGLTHVGRLPNFVAIPHGNTMEEYLGCAMELSRIPRVTTLGIAEKDAIKLAGGDRGKLVRAIIGLKKDIHLFGMMEDMSDILDPWIRTSVRGIDGSKLVVWGMRGTHVMPFPPDPPNRLRGIPETYPGRPIGFFETQKESVDDVALRAIQSNVRRWREFANYGWPLT